MTLASTATASQRKFALDLKHDWFRLENKYQQPAQMLRTLSTFLMSEEETFGIWHLRLFYQKSQKHSFVNF